MVLVRIVTLGCILLVVWSKIASVDGDIDVTGQGGNGSGSSNRGVYLNAGTVIESTGTGANAAKNNHRWYRWSGNK